MVGANGAVEINVYTQQFCHWAIFHGSLTSQLLLERDHVGVVFYTVHVVQTDRQDRQQLLSSEEIHTGSLPSTDSIRLFIYREWKVLHDAICLDIYSRGTNCRTSIDRAAKMQARGIPMVSLPR